MHPDARLAASRGCLRLTPYPGTATSFVVMAGLTIGKFAAAEGVGVETVRFYRRRGLLARRLRRRELDGGRGEGHRHDLARCGGLDAGLARASGAREHEDGRTETGQTMGHAALNARPARPA